MVQMIEFYGFAPAFDLPSPGPFAMKTEIHLKMAGRPYERRFEGNASAPKGKLPYIVDGARAISDSTFIRLYLERQYAVDLDTGYGDSERAMAWSIERLVEDQLYWAMVYSRWSLDENFAKGPAHFFDELPDDVQDMARQKQRRAVLGYLDGQGLGRHSVEEITELTQIGYGHLATLLGAKPFLLGDRPCGADASVFAQLASVLTPFFDSSIRRAAAEHENLIAYRDRLMAAYFPAFG
jgi:glutathione S-transferase